MTHPTKRLAGCELRICKASPPRLWRNDRQLMMVEGAQMLGFLHRFRIEAMEQGGAARHMAGTRGVPLRPRPAG